MTDVRERAQTTALLSGVDALVQLLAVRHQLDERDGLSTATMVSGYPGSPLGIFDLALERQGDLLTAHQIVHRPGLNEELAAAIVWGSQMGAVIDYDGLDGVVGAWYGKGPGRSGDAMRHANAMGSGPNGGVVMFCGDDPSSKSSTLACDSNYTFADACMPVLFPGDQQDIIDFGVHAYRMSRYSGSWVGLKIVTSVADGIGTVDLDLDRHRPVEPGDFTVNGLPWRHVPLRTVGQHAVPDQEALVVERRLKAAQAYARANHLDRVVGAAPGARLGIVCAGKTYCDVVQAFADHGVGLAELADFGVRILKLGLTFPVVEPAVTEFAASVGEVFVVEEKRPFVETQLRSILHEARCATPVVGKRDRAGELLVASVGELAATAVGAALRRVLPSLGERGPARSALPMLQLPPRPPGFCSGCPHNRSTLFPDGALVGGGVGCHGIMYFEERHKGMRSLPPTPMGAEGVPWIGLSPFVSEPHVIQNMGDGTLSHSGTLAIRASVAAGVDITFKILYNAAVAMTGGQDVTGLMDVPAMTRALEAEGVRRIVVCAEDPKHYGSKARWASGVTVLGRDRLPTVQEDLRQSPGVSVIIYDQQCAAEARRLRKRGLQPEPPRRIVINEAVCEGCGDCSAKSNCLSVVTVATEFGTKRQVHDPSCNRDYTCLEGDCPSFVSLKPSARGRRRPAAARTPARDRVNTAGRRPDLPSGALPTPPRPVVDRRYSIYFTGIGGTGVVTANRIIAAAAEAAGFVVGGVDQTGLSQKAGAVVSHLQLAADRASVGTATVSADGADLYLSGDIMQAASPGHLAKARPDHAIAVIDRTLTPTAAMLTSGVPAPDIDSLVAAITERVGAARAHFLAPQRVADVVFSDHLMANVALLGAAFQLGGFPMSAADFEAAMAGPGNSAAANQQAFAWGRWAVHDPAAVEAALASVGDGHGSESSPFDPSAAALRAAAGLVAERGVPAELTGLLVRRAAQVIDYQSEGLARRFLELPGRVAAVDAAERRWALTRAVTESWFKLLTYKDEYEVARLHLKVNTDQVAGELGIEGPYTVTYHLHPPILRRLGMAKKLPMGKPYELAFHVLRGMRRLRGTPLDVFGYDRDRRTERAVISEYEQIVAGLLRGPAGSYELLTAIAESAGSIRGYGPIKEAAVGKWRRRVAELRDQATAGTEVSA